MVLIQFYPNECLLHASYVLGEFERALTAFLQPGKGHQKCSIKTKCGWKKRGTYQSSSVSENIGLIL